MNRAGTHLKKVLFFQFAYLAALISPVSISAQSLNNTASMQECLLTSEDYAVYSAVLLDRGKLGISDELGDNKANLIISEVTDPQKDGKSSMWGKQLRSKQQPQPSDNSVEHFNLRQKYVCQLKPQLDKAITYRFFPEQERREIFERDNALYWDGFYKKYPKSSGYLSLSHVGYGAQGTEALVYVGHHCGYMCGTGYLVLLAKENGHWAIKNHVILWVS